jgi:hypothetical protein
VPNPLLGLDDDNPLSSGGMDAFNRLALGPMYAPRDPAALSGSGAGPVPIEVSSGPVRGISNMVRFREDASAIHATLPEVPDGHTRLWRGNRPDEVGSNPQFTNDLPGIALPFREMYGGPVSYVDVPTASLGRYLQTAGAAPDAEFILPGELAARATAVHVTPRTTGPGPRPQQQPDDGS